MKKFSQAHWVFFATALLFIIFNTGALALPPGGFTDSYPRLVDFYYQNTEGKVYQQTARVTLLTDKQNPWGDKNTYVAEYSNSDGGVKKFFVREQTLADYQDVQTYYKEHPQERVSVARSSGGDSPGKVIGPVIYVEPNIFKQRVGDKLQVATEFRDLDSPESDKGPLRRTKTLPLTGFDEKGRPVLEGATGPFSYPEVSKNKVEPQRFVIDLGRHPKDNTSMVYPVHVDSYEGENALIVTGSQLGKIEKAKPGEAVEVTYWEVPRDVLRVVPKDDQGKGDEFLSKAQAQFTADKGDYPLTFSLQKKGYVPVTVLVEAEKNPKDTLYSVRAAGSCLIPFSAL